MVARLSQPFVSKAFVMSLTTLLAFTTVNACIRLWTICLLTVRSDKRQLKQPILVSEKLTITTV